MSEAEKLKTAPDYSVMHLSRFLVANYGVHAGEEAKRHVVAYKQANKPADREIAKIWQGVCEILEKNHGPKAA